MTKKKLAAVLGSAIILLGGGAAVRQKTVVSKQAAAIQTAPVKRGEFVKTTSSSGKTKATRSVDLKFQTSGRLAWVGVREGDSVATYSALAGLDPREVQKTLTKTLRDYSAQRLDFEQAWKDNWAAAAESHEPVDHAPSDEVRHILEKNQWDLDKAVLDVELKNLAVEYATLVTPIAGVVTHIDTPVAGVNITPATSVFTVVDPTSMVFEVNTDETDVGALRLGQKAAIMLDAYPTATFSGTITYISYASEISAGGATVFPVQIRFDEPQNVRVGLNGDVTIDAVSIPDALTVPIEAIREEDGTKYVYKKSGTKYVKATVNVGEQSDTVAVIKEGLMEGDMVITKGFTNIPNG